MPSIGSDSQARLINLINLINRAALALWAEDATAASAARGTRHAAAPVDFVQLALQDGLA
jgi:hypothetical protein